MTGAGEYSGMRIVAYLVVLCVAAVIIAYVIGRSLPVTHLASRGERFGAPRHEVWRLVSDVANYPSWRPGLVRVELLPEVEGRLAWREVGRRSSVEFVAEEAVPPERFVARITSTGLAYGGSWRFELSPEAGGTRLTIVEEGELYNPILRFLVKYVVGETATIEQVLAAVGGRLARSS